MYLKSIYSVQVEHLSVRICVTNELSNTPYKYNQSLVGRLEREELIIFF